ncbi:MAG: beta-eliminating lyase-related protein [Chloroflexota bacterium]
MTTEPLDPQAVRRACRRFLTHHYRQSPRDVLADLAAFADPELESDTYGAGPLIADFEAEIAALLGKEAAVFLPSGTMAQPIALRIWADRARNHAVAFHPTCHLELHEQSGYRVLHGLRGVLVGSPHRPLTRADLDGVREPVSALLLELPQREIGGQLPAWEELEAQCAWARERGARLHLDGARLWECRPFYGREYAEIAGLFDSVYVSFYKTLGGIAGAALAGPADLIAEARIWQRRQGGNLVRLFPYVLSARRALAERLGRIEAYVTHARQVAAALAALPELTLQPDPPHTNMFHLFIRGDRGALERALLEVAAETGVWLFHPLRPCQVPGHWVTEWVVGDAGLDVSPEETAGLLREVLRRAA